MQATHTNTFSAQLSSAARPNEYVSLVDYMQALGMPVMLGPALGNANCHSVATISPTTSYPVSSLARQEPIPTYPSTAVSQNLFAMPGGFVQVASAEKLSKCFPGVSSMARVDMELGTENSQESMNMHTRVKSAPVGAAGGLTGGACTQKLWKKYGEKTVQPGR